MSGDPESSPTKDPTTGESSLPSDPDTLEPDDKPSDKESDDPEVVEDDIVPAANTGVTFIPAGNVPSGSTPTCELDPSACEDTRPPGAGVDICEIRPDLTQCQEPAPPTTPPGEEEPPTNPEEPEPEEPELPVCGIWPLPDCPENPDNQAPTAPVVNACEVETSTRATISWSKSEDPDGKVAGYNVYRDPDARMSDNGKRSATFDGLTPGETYTFWVRAVDSDGKQSEESNRVECVMDTEAPDVPADVTVTPIEPTASNLEVSWSPSEDNPDEGAVGGVTYNVYRDGELVARNLDDTTYPDSGLEEGTKYAYRVEAVDRAGNVSDRSERVVGETGRPPTTPTNVRITDVSALGFTVTWDASTDQDGVTPQAEIVYSVSIEGGGLCVPPGDVTGETTVGVTCVNLLGAEATATVTAEDGDGNKSQPSDPASTSDQPTNDAPALRSNTPSKTESDAPADKPALPEAPVEVPSDKPTEEKSPLLPGLDDVLPGGEDTAEAPAEAPAEEPAEPEATPSESESPAARPTTEEPADEATEDAPAEEDEGGLVSDIVDSVTSAVAAVF